MTLVEQINRDNVTLLQKKTLIKECHSSDEIISAIQHYRKKQSKNREVHPLLQDDAAGLQEVHVIISDLRRQLKKKSRAEFNKLVLEEKAAAAQAAAQAAEGGKKVKRKPAKRKPVKRNPTKTKPAKRKPAKTKPAKRKPAKPTGKKKVRKIHKGPRGGRYYISKGRKVYL